MQLEGVSVDIPTVLHDLGVGLVIVKVLSLKV